MKQYSEWQLKRIKAYKESELPYCFEYKIKTYFYNTKCPICNFNMITGRHSVTIQHNIPISKGGKHSLDNISVICKECNIKLRDTETGCLNNQTVVEVWNKMIEQGLVNCK